MTEPQSPDNQLQPDAPITPSNEPGSQSSSGMSTQFNDVLVDALEREKRQRGEPLDIAEESPGSPINRSPEASTGPVQE